MNRAGSSPGSLPRRVWRGLVRLPLVARLALLVLAVIAAFAAVVLPLFSGGGPPHAEIAGLLPSTVLSGSHVRADIALDNTGDSIIFPLCVTMSGEGAELLSADFQGLDVVAASRNRVCGGQLTGQETISITLVFRLTRPGASSIRLVPQQGSAVIGPAFTSIVTAT